MSEEAHRIVIADVYSRFPAGRYRSDGPYSGERFRDDFLIPALLKGKVLLVLDGLTACPSSFYEEVTGGLVRSGLGLKIIRDRLDIVAESARFRRYPQIGYSNIENALSRTHQVKHAG